MARDTLMVFERTIQGVKFYPLWFARYDLLCKELQSRTLHTTQVPQFFEQLCLSSPECIKNAKGWATQLGTKQLHKWAQQRVWWFDFVNEEAFTHNSV